MRRRKIGRLSKFELQKIWRLSTSFLRVLPDFILPGAPKCATSSLYEWLTQHPMVRRASCKEPTNFIHYPTSELRLRMHFPFRFGRRFLTGEASVEYFTHPHAAEHIHAIVPHVRLIFVLRNPIERAWSDYCMFVKFRAEREDFDTVIRRSMQWFAYPEIQPLLDSALKNAFSPVRYLASGLYADVLSRWFRYFPREQCLVVFQEDLLEDPRLVQSKILQHLQLPFFTSPEPFPHERKGKRLGSMQSATYELLANFYKEPDDRLEALLGMQLPWRKKISPPSSLPLRYSSH